MQSQNIKPQSGYVSQKHLVKMEVLMIATARLKNFNRLATIFVITVFYLCVGTTIAQETKQERCDKLTDLMETFNRECYNGEFLDTFSPELVDSFTFAVNHDDEMSRLDNFLSRLQNNPQATGYIVTYGGRTNKYGEYDIRVGRLKAYIEFRKFDISRIKFVSGGFREKFEFELWISPIKNSFPPLSPTITPEKVRFRGKMKPFTL